VRRRDRRQRDQRDNKPHDCAGAIEVLASQFLDQRLHVIASRLVGAYGPEDVRFLSLAAAQIALAMDAARNFHESQRAEERLRLLLDLTNRIVSNLDLRALLREVSASIRHVMHCEGAAVSLPDPETGELRLVALDFPGSKGIVREGLASKDLTNSVARVFATGQALNMTREELQADGRARAKGRSRCAACHSSAATACLAS